MYRFLFALAAFDPVPDLESGPVDGDPTGGVGTTLATDESGIRPVGSNPDGDGDPGVTSEAGDPSSEEANGL